MRLSELAISRRHYGGEKTFDARDLSRKRLWYFYFFKVKFTGALLVLIMHTFRLFLACPGPDSIGAPTIQGFYEADPERIFCISELFC